MVYIYFHVLASVDKGTHGFPGPGQQLASLSSLMGVSPSASSALSSVVHAPGKLEDPPGAPARFCKAENAILLMQVKDDNVTKGGPERPVGMCALAN